MRVLFIVGSFPAISEPFVINQVAGVLERGHEALVYAAYGPPKQPNLDHPLVVKHRLADLTLESPEIPAGWAARLASGANLAMRGLPRAPLQTMQLLNFQRYGWQAASLQLLHRGARLIGQQSFDIIHCQFGTLGLLGLSLRRAGILKGPLVTTFRGHDISSFVRANGAHVYDELFREGDYFIANCEFFRRRLELMGCAPERTAVLYSGIEVDRFLYRGPRHSNDKTLRLLFVGRLVEKKGLRYLIDAAAILKAKGVRFTLTIGGDGPLRQALENQVAALDLAGTVELVGACPQARVIELLQNSDMFVSPSVTSKDGDEDAPVNTLKEAMLIGLPVVATRHGGIPELVEHGVNGYLVRERDAHGLADYLYRLSNERHLWERMGERGRRRVEVAFSSSRLNGSLLELYERTLNLTHSSDALRLSRKSELEFDSPPPVRSDRPPGETNGSQPPA